MAKIMDYYFSRDSNYIVSAFTVNKSFIKTQSFLKKKIIEFENIEKTHPPDEFTMFVALGPSKVNKIREAKYIEAKSKGYSFANYISPNSVCNSPLGDNNFIGDMSVINPFVVFGNNNLVWEHVIINNSVKIGNNCYMSPKSSIGTKSIIKDNSIIGTGSTIKTGVTVREETLVGANCYISIDTKKNGVYGEKNSKMYGRLSHKVNITL